MEEILEEKTVASMICGDVMNGICVYVLDPCF